MSPNEFDLRSALHDGEGDVPDADRAIMDALRARDHRRRRITSVASSVAVVAVIAVGGTLFLRSADVPESGDAGGGGTLSQPALGAQAPGHATHGGSPQPSEQRSAGSADSTKGAAGASPAGPCPAQFPQLMLPGGGGTNQFGAAGPLFGTPVAAIKVCVYPPGDDGTLELSGDRAQQLAAALEDAPVTAKLSNCVVSAPQLAMYAATTSGTLLRVVTAEPVCGAYRVTNGTAVRIVPLTQFGALHLSNAVVPSPNQGTPIK